MTAPILALELRVFAQQQLRTAPFQAFNQNAHPQRRRVTQVQVDMIFTDDTFENLHIQRITAGPPSRFGESTPDSATAHRLSGHDTDIWYSKPNELVSYEPSGSQTVAAS